jgi:hypothetical protein
MNGKQKGSAYEREICKKLSLWISHGERDDLLWRSAMSGGRATIQAKKGKENKSQTGDISPIDKLGQSLTDRFIIECKFYNNLDIVSGIIKGKGVLWAFWRKLVKDSVAAGKKPMLIVKQNRLPTLMLTDQNGEIALSVQGYWFPHKAKVADISQWQCGMFLFDELIKQSRYIDGRRDPC